MLPNLLTRIFFGKKLADFPIDQQDEVALESINRFVLWMAIKLPETFPDDRDAKTVAIRLRAAHQFHDQNVFTKFPLTQKYLVQMYNLLIDEATEKSN